MIESEFWWQCPVWFISSTMLWVCLNALCEHFHISERLSKRYGWTRRAVQKWQERITTVASLAITLIIIFAVMLLTGFDLMNWE